MESIVIKIPATGLPVRQELDVAVDMFSPELKGPYVSYWRMISPSGEMFGERLWVIMQVTEKVKTVYGRNAASTYRRNGALSAPSSLPYPLREQVKRKLLLFMQGQRFPSPVQGTDGEQQMHKP
ncbi:hypothetical protein F511_16839 [Dorcoceras hygrometricum]|uniref:Nbr1 FW domain-containing protein n=1 Tax=Dorcoceras hygrometricum TaxID=472368 RepID=A0A2Z7ANZ2_9LAMI|nr:hypothetical protein F511_16839 [Dorcoceras hygrometricum]